MVWKKYDALLDLIDERIETSEPRRAEYFRGYLRGIHFHVHGSLEETAQEHNRLCNGSDVDNGSNVDSGDAYLDAFARGYRDGCKGLKPADN